MDVLNRLLLTSDPVITGMRAAKKRNKKSLSNEVLELLEESDLLNLQVNSCDSE